MRHEPPVVPWVRQLVLAAGLLAGLLLAACQSQGQAPARTSAFWVASAPAGPRIWLVLSAEADSALTTGLDTATVEPGDSYVFINDAGHAHHIGIVTQTPPSLAGIAGNTSEDGTSSNGTGCFEHPLDVIPAHVGFFRVPGVSGDQA